MKKMKVVAILLAAGSSTRMGENKLALPFNQSTIGATALKTTLRSKVDHVLVITKDQDNLHWLREDEDVLHGQGKWSKIECKNASEGQAHSLLAGIVSAEAIDADAVIILLGDQPLVGVEMINRLIEIFQLTIAEQQEILLVASRFKGKEQPPLLCAKSMFPMLKPLTGDMGARKIIRQLPKWLGKTVDYDDGRGFYDIDTKEDYQWVMKMME